MGRIGSGDRETSYKEQVSYEDGDYGREEERATGRPLERGWRLERNVCVVLMVACLSAILCLGRILLADSGAETDRSGSVSQTQLSDGADAEGTDAEEDGLTDSEREAQMLQEIQADPDKYTQALVELAEKNPETIYYVYQYPELSDKTYSIDLSEEAASDTVPLLIQWDSRWGYLTYGSGLIGYTGCGPTCLSMVAIYLTGDASYDPATVAGYSEKAGYYIEDTGTSWDLMRQGCEHFGLVAEELALDENKMVAALEEGRPLICAVGEGDFTTSGHFIVVTGYTDGAFTVNDPNSPQRSAQVWTFARLSGQINDIWAFSLA